jgi:hypothetical protein
LLVLRGRAARRPEDRIAAARDGMRIGRRLAANDAITHMVAIASYVAGLTTLRHDVEDGSVDPSTARAALGDLLAAEWWSRMDDVLRQERAHTIWSFRAMRDGRLKPSAEDKQNWPSQADMRNPAAASPFIAACDVCTKATKWSPLPYATWRRRFDALLDETGARSNAFVGIVPASVAGRLCRADAQTRLARVALAVAEHRATRADFPASLDDLKPLFPDGVPLDPCTDAPFVYEKTVTGVRIASPGRLPEDPPLDDATLRERCLVWELKR